MVACETTSPTVRAAALRRRWPVTVVGQAIATGTEDGIFELWFRRYKWTHDRKLSCRVPKYTQPMLTKDVARSVSAHEFLHEHL